MLNTQLISKNVEINTINGTLIGALEQDLVSAPNKPISKFVHVLYQHRALSQQSRNYKDEMDVAKKLATDLEKLANEYDINTHFSIDTSGEPLVIKERQGEHVILPTHFEKGAYFSHPHADHQMDISAEQLPKIKVGRYTRFGKNVGVNVGADLTIGEGVWFSPNSYVLKQDHCPYSRPAVGARTVRMTKLPAMKICDYAWLGKLSEAGWDCDYVGKSSIIATRSFINSWVSDYSLTGNHGKIIQYFPYKAALFELWECGFEEMLKIDDWYQVNEIWLKQYHTFCQENSFHEPVSLLKNTMANLSVGKNVLDLNPQYGDAVCYAAGKGLNVDVISIDRKNFPVILQRIQDSRFNNIRLRADLDLSKLPFVDGKYYSLRYAMKGYDLVINDLCNLEVDDNNLERRMAESYRVAKPGGKIYFSVQGNYDFSKIVIFAQQLKMHCTDSGYVSHPICGRCAAIVFEK